MSANRWPKRMHWFLISLIGLLFIRPVASFRLYSDIDDRCYLKFAGALVGETVQGCIGGSYPPGIALFWMPASLVAKIVSHLNEVPFEQLAPVFIGILAFVYWAIGLHLYLLAANDRKYLGTRIALYLAAPALFYATHRVTMVHAVEIFLASLMYFGIQRDRLTLLVFAALGMVATRLNDFPALFLVLSFAIGMERKEDWRKKIQGLIWVFLIGVLAFIAWIAFVKGYHSMKVFQVIQRLGFRRFGDVLWGGDWGLLFTGFFYVFAMIYGCARFRVLTSLQRACIAWLGIEFCILIGWRGNGSDFGYRYLIGSSVAAWLLWDRALAEEKLTRWRWPAIASSVFLLWLTWVYKILPETTPVLTDQKYWTVPGFLAQSIRGLVDPRFLIEPFGFSLVGAPFVTSFDVFHPASLMNLENESGLSRGMINTILWIFIAGLTLLFAGVFYKNYREKTTIIASEKE